MTNCAVYRNIVCFCKPHSLSYDKMTTVSRFPIRRPRPSPSQQIWQPYREQDNILTSTSLSMVFLTSTLQTFERMTASLRWKTFMTTILLSIQLWQPYCHNNHNLTTISLYFFISDRNFAIAAFSANSMPNTLFLYHLLAFVLNMTTLSHFLKFWLQLPDTINFWPPYFITSLFWR